MRVDLHRPAARAAAFTRGLEALRRVIGIDEVERVLAVRRGDDHTRDRRLVGDGERCQAARIRRRLERHDITRVEHRGRPA